jgi:hypothetical protein
MDIGDVISDSMRYPSSNWTKVIILGVLFLISFLIVPLFLALGYLFRVIKASLAGSEELPEFEEWGEMLIDGIKIFLVNIIYTLPALIISIFLFVTLWSSIWSMSYLSQISGSASPDIFYSIFGGTFLLGIIVAGIYMLVIYPIIAVALGNMAYYDGEFGSAFRLSEIIAIISDIGWVDLIIWYVVVLIVAMVITFIGGIIGIIPILGWIILIFIVYPYIYLFYGRSIAWLYASAFNEEYEP